jgi:hypothetical protein
MGYLKINTLFMLLTLIFTISCMEPAVTFSRIEYNIPGHINIRKEELTSAFGEIETDSASRYYIVVTIYSYSTGTERISFSGGNEVKTVSGRGRLKVLLKVMDGKNILRAEFVEAEGNSKEEMLSSLAGEIKLKLQRQ